VVANAATNIAAEAALEELGELGELGKLGKLVVIELDKGENKSHDKDVYTAFKELIEVEDY
jgi:hypothetical protein